MCPGCPQQLRLRDALGSGAFAGAHMCPGCPQQLHSCRLAKLGRSPERIGRPLQRIGGLAHSRRHLHCRSRVHPVQRPARPPACPARPPHRLVGIGLDRPCLPALHPRRMIVHGSIPRPCVGGRRPQRVRICAGGRFCAVHAPRARRAAFMRLIGRCATHRPHAHAWQRPLPCRGPWQVRPARWHHTAARPSTWPSTRTGCRGRGERRAGWTWAIPPYPVKRGMISRPRSLPVPRCAPLHSSTDPCPSFEAAGMLFIPIFSRRAK